MADYGIETLMAHLGEDRRAHKGAVVPPLYQNSLFTFESWEAIDHAFNDRVHSCIYTRGNNPTVLIAEGKIAALAGGERAKLFGSGMAAISAAVLHFLKPGAHVIAVSNIYGPAGILLSRYLTKQMQIQVTYIDGRTVEEFERAIRPDTCLIYLESPASAVFSLQDIAGVSSLARQRKIPTIIDNTWATPVFQRPLEMGIDLEVHSCSKYLGGHSDLVAGVVVGSARHIETIAGSEYELLGGKMAPFEAWLLTRSLRTITLRMRKHQENAMTVARFLEHHPDVKTVYYPGLESFQQYALGARQMSGYSGLMSFVLNTGDIERVKAFVNGLGLFSIGVSWGGHESLVYAPAISYSKELPASEFAARGIDPGMVRISVGLEDARDLIRDLEQGFFTMKRTAK